MENKFESFIDKIKNIKTLSKGLNNDNYLINDKYVWKNIKNKYLFDHKNEINIMKASNKFTLYYYDDNNLCYNFIEGENMENDQFHNNIDKLIIETKLYHNIQVDTKNFWYEIIPEWINQLDTKKREIINLMYNNLSDQLKNIHDDEDLVLCHHDIHSGNIIENDDTISFIDLEFSFKNYYYVDLANIICEMFTDYDKEIYSYEKINDDIKIKVINLYHNKNFTDKNQCSLLFKKINIGMKISHFYWYLWGILVSSNNKDVDFDYIKFSDSRLCFIN